LRYRRRTDKQTGTSYKFSDLFTDKVQHIRDNISAALQQSTDRLFATGPHTGPQLSAFQQVAVGEVRKLLTSMPCKTSPLDVLSCSLLKDCADAFAPAIARLANLSLQPGTLPAWFKSAQVLPLLKKAVSKVLERLVQARLRPHLMNSANFSQFQPAYSQGHCTETALLNVLDNVYTAANEKQVTVPIGLDLSAVCDIV